MELLLQLASGVATKVKVDFVVLAPQRRQSRYRQNCSSAWHEQLANVFQRGPVIFNVFEHVQHQNDIRVALRLVARIKVRDIDAC